MERNPNSPDWDLTEKEYIQKYRNIDLSGKAHADFTNGRIPRSLYHGVISRRFEDMNRSIRLQYGIESVYRP